MKKKLKTKQKRMQLQTQEQGKDKPSKQAGARAKTDKPLYPTPSTRPKKKQRGGLPEMHPTFEESADQVSPQGRETNVAAAETSAALAAALGIIKTITEVPKTTEVSRTKVTPPVPPLQPNAVVPDQRYEKLLESAAAQNRADELARRYPLRLDPRRFLTPTNSHHPSPPQPPPLPTTTTSTGSGLSSLCVRAHRAQDQAERDRAFAAQQLQSDRDFMMKFVADALIPEEIRKAGVLAMLGRAAAPVARVAPAVLLGAAPAPAALDGGAAPAALLPPPTGH